MRTYNEIDNDLAKAEKKVKILSNDIKKYIHKITLVLSLKVLKFVIINNDKTMFNQEMLSKYNDYDRILDAVLINKTHNPLTYDIIDEITNENGILRIITLPGSNTTVNINPPLVWIVTDIVKEF